MISAEMKTQLSDFLFSFNGDSVYALVSVAAVEDLAEALAEYRPEHCCLYSGKLTEETQSFAPYLIKLKKDSPFYDFLLTQWGYHFGSLAIIPDAISFNDVRSHFRSLLMVKNHEKVAVYFRFYDPRVLRSFLPICNPDKIPDMFGPVKLFVVEGKDPTRVNRFWVESDRVASKESTFVAA